MPTPCGSWTSSTTSTAGDYYDWTTATDAGTATYTIPRWMQTYTVPMPQPDPEVVRRHELQERRREPLEQWRENTRKIISERQKKEECEASQLAKRLLLEYLDENNRKNFADEKPLEVESGIHPGVKYQIPYYDGRIKAQRGDKVVSELCLQVKAPEWIPHEDKLLAKMLYLRSDEATALRTANHSYIKENLLEGLS
ncbi:MAG: hypothetical protein V1854_04805 [Methanobacteriota archaeon]